VSDITYDPACRDCRSEANKPNVKITWQCFGHIIAERDRLEIALAELSNRFWGRIPPQFVATGTFSTPPRGIKTHDGPRCTNCGASLYFTVSAGGKNE